MLAREADGVGLEEKHRSWGPAKVALGVVRHGTASHSTSQPFAVLK